MATPGPLGYIIPALRTNDQIDAHAAAMAKAVRFSLAPKTLGPGEKLILTDFWKDPEIVADCGQVFTGFGQNTGSCVGVSAGNAIATLSFVQRKIADTPTKAMIPWWGFFYGRTRYNEGDTGQGEGAVDSVMGETLIKEGVFSVTESGLPAFTSNDQDGMWLTSGQEMTWSDGARIDPKWMTLAKTHPLGGQAQLNSPDDIETAIVNGYPVLDGCNNYMGSGSIQGSGAEARVQGHYDGSGGHSTCFLGVWHHPSAGRLFLYSNQWSTGTYPKDPAGGGRCTCWMPDSEVAKLFRTGGDGGETMALSHLNWFPAQPKVLNWAI